MQPKTYLQDDLFGAPQVVTPGVDRRQVAPHVPTSPTSKLAADSNPSTFRSKREAIHAAVYRAGALGMTRREIADALFDGKQHLVTGAVFALLSANPPRLVELTRARRVPGGDGATEVQVVTRNGGVVLVDASVPTAGRVTADTLRDDHFDAAGRD